MNNSISKTLTDFNIQYRNVLELWEKLTIALTTDEENIIVELTNTTDGTNYTIPIPSINYLAKEVSKLQQLYSQLINPKTNTVLTDVNGNTTKITFTPTYKEPNTIQTISSPTVFDIKTNWFFENFLYPLIYVNFSYSNIESDLFEVTKLILNTDLEEDKQYFKDVYLGRDDIDFNIITNDLDNRGIGYILDVDELSATVKENVYYGNFTVTKLFDDTKVITTGNVTETVIRKRIVLHSLNYNSKLINLQFTEKLVVGDLLTLKNSTYRIIDIDKTTNSIFVETVLGFDTIRVGDVLKYQSSNIDNVDIQVPIAFDNYIVTFIRPIQNKLVSNYYSPGAAYFTNDLIINIDGEDVTLADYYRDNVLDFGQHIFALAKDKQIPSVLGVNPNSPELLNDNFKVVEINSHLTANNNIDTLKTLVNNKEIEEQDSILLDSQIKTLQQKINTKTSTNLKVDSEQLITLKTKKDSIDKNVSSLIKKIKTTVTNSNITKPKYRIRGFWDIPTPTYNPKTGLQNVIQFIIQYRYKNINNNTGNINDLEYKTVDGKTETAIFSNWIEIKTPVRKKILVDGVYVWKTENVASGDEVNINQLDIPIKANEKVDIRIKSISEAGFPLNPLESEWSNIITVEFIDNNNDGVLDELDNILISTDSEEQTIKIKNELNELGVTEHLMDKTIIDNKLFNHTAQTIFSGIYDNTIPLSIEDVLKTFQTKLNAIVNSKEEEAFNIQLVDDNNVITNINTNVTNKIFAGYYKNLVQGETIPMGTIVTKIYTLKIVNTSTNSLILESLDKGSTTLYSTVDVIDNVSLSYKDIPVGLFTGTTGYKQRKNQFIYNRNSGLNGVNLYETASDITFYNLDVNATDCVLDNTNYDSVSLDADRIYIHSDSDSVTGGSYVGDIKKLPSTINTENKQSLYNQEHSIIFEDSDKYLIGKNSTGAFAFILVNDELNSNLLVNGNTIFSNLIIEGNRELNIPIVFQFRLTDYYGDSTTIKPTGRIGGLPNLTNMSIKKTLGFDLKTKYGGVIGFDIEFSTTYKNTGVYIKEVERINQRTLSTEIN